MFREEKRELTFDERLEKARMQKDRVENEGDESPNTTSAAQGSTVTSTAPMASSSRANGQRRENHKENNTNHNNSGRGRNHQNGSNNSAGAGAGQHRQNGNGERDRQPKRDNNYSNRYEVSVKPMGNHCMMFFQNQNQNQNQNTSYNQQNHPQGYQQQQYHQQMNFNQQHQSNYRGSNPRGRGGYSNQRTFQPRFKPQNQPLPPQQVAGTFIPQMPQQMMDPQLLATINAFQNQQISMPPAVARMPLLPGPFGLQRPPFQQDVKFRNTWLDASTYPIPLTAVINFDRIRGMQTQSVPHQTYRGRGRGGYQYRGGYRGEYSSGNGYQRPAAGSAPGSAPGAAEPSGAENGVKIPKEKEKGEPVKVEEAPETSTPSPKDATNKNEK